MGELLDRPEYLKFTAKTSINHCLIGDTKDEEVEEEKEKE